GERILLTWEGFPEDRLVARLPQPLDRLLRRQIHLHVRLDRPFRLLLERGGPSIPELRVQEGGVEHGGAVPRSLAGALPDGDFTRIHAPRSYDVAGVAGDDPRAGELRLEEQLVPERN